MKTKGEIIKKLRIKKGLTQEEVGDRIGTSKQTLYKYENGIITNIPSDKIEALSNLFDVSPSVIMGWENPLTIGNMGAIIKNERNKKGWTQEELGAKLGVQKSVVAKYENGHVENMKRAKIEKLAKLFGVSPAYLMGWQEDLTKDDEYFQMKLLERPDILKLNKKLLNESEEFVLQIDSYINFIIEQKNKY